MRNIYQKGIKNFTEGKLTNKIGITTFVIGMLGAVLADKFNIQPILENPDIYWCAIGLVSSGLIFGGKK